MAEETLRFRTPRWRKKIRRLYVRHLRSRVRTPLGRQRLRLVWYAPSYLRLLAPSALGWRDRLAVVSICVRTDWQVEHAHRGPEIVAVLQQLAGRRGRGAESVVEAGCWRGGATIKLAAVCARLDLDLQIFDSFEGVEAHMPEEGEFDFSGQYRSSPGEVEANLGRFGLGERCRIVPGRFERTMTDGSLAGPVRLALIDCDLAKGTEEVLRGVVPLLSVDGVVLSQDFHIPEVRRALTDRAFWTSLGAPVPPVEHLGYQVAAVGPVRID